MFSEHPMYAMRSQCALSRRFVASYAMANSSGSTLGIFPAASVASTITTG